MKSNYYNPLVWMAWCRDSAVAWFSTIPWGDAPKAIPALLLTLILFIIGFVAFSRGTGWRQRLLDRQYAVAMELDDFPTAEIVVRRQLETQPTDVRLQLKFALLRDHQGFSKEADAVMVSTGSRPRIPDWAEPDGDRVLTTRDAYPPKEMPSHLVVVGSGVTGVEFVHMFSSLGAEVTLIVSRQQVLPGKDPEVAAVLEDDFLGRGVNLFKGARAIGVDRTDDGVAVRCNDGRVARGSHVLLAIGSVPNVEGVGLDAAGVEMDGSWVRNLDHHMRTNVPHIYFAGDVSGKLPLSSVASKQGRKIAEHVMGLHKVDHRHLDYEKAASAIFTEPEIADVGLAEADAFAEGRKVRVTKVPFASSAKALINNDPRGFVKIISDPATGVVLGGSIVGKSAAELIAVIAVAVTNGLSVNDLAECIFVHPALSEALTEAAE